MIFSKKSISILACVLSFTFADNLLLAQPGRGPAAVAASKVVRLSRAGSESFVGTLHPLRKSIVGTAVDGRVISIDLKPGDPVSADPEISNADGKFVGQAVMQLRTGTLEIEIGGAEIQLKLAQQALEELEISLPKLIELAGANAKVAEAGLQYSKNNYDRSLRLSGVSEAISQGELEQAHSKFVADQESANAARIDFEKLQATRELQLVQASLRVESSQQEVKRLYDMKAKYTIRAPFEGLVTQKLTDVGEWVTKGQPVVEVVQLNPIEMIINTPQEHLPRLQKSLASSTDEKPLIAKIEVEGYDEPLQGTVKRIVAQADLRSRTFPVRIEIENPVIGNGYALQPGMLGRATLLIDVQDMLMVKKDALVLGGNKAIVFKIVPQEDGTVVVSVPVVIGKSIGDWIQVKGDLNPTDTVVLLGNERLKSGQAVRVTRTSEETPK